MITIAFTGTRNGMTEPQRLSVIALLRRITARYLSQTFVALHGDCVGADVDFHRVCRQLGIDVEKRPSNWDGTVAGTDARQVAEPKRPYERNRDIVHSATVLIGCPPNDEFLPRGSGTWYTIDYAKRQGKPVFVVTPDGRVNGEVIER